MGTHTHSKRLRICSRRGGRRNFDFASINLINAIMCARASSMLENSDMIFILEMVNSFLNSRQSIGRSRCAHQARAIKCSNDRYGVALWHSECESVHGDAKESNYKKQVRVMPVWLSCTQEKHTYVRRTCPGVFIDSRLHGIQSFLFWFESASHFC